MEEKLRCQSCGMPLGEYDGKDNFGRFADGVINKEYCMYCFTNSQFSEPNLTLEGMIDKSVNHMMAELSMSQDEAKKMANSFIPKLNRWNN